MKRQDVDLIGVDQSVHDSVGAANDLANLWVGEFGDCAARFGEGLELVGRRNQLADDNRGIVRGVLCNERLDGR